MSVNDQSNPVLGHELSFCCIVQQAHLDHGDATSEIKRLQLSARLKRKTEEDDRPLRQIFALVPCGHARFCSGCIDRLVEMATGCPICRADIHMVMRVYIEYDDVL